MAQRPRLTLRVLMRQRLFNFAAAASLMLCLTTLYLNWVSRADLVSLALPLHAHRATGSGQAPELTTYLVDAFRGRVRFAVVHPLFGDLAWRPSEHSLAAWRGDSAEAARVWGIEERGPRVAHYAWDGMSCVVYSGRAYAASKDPLAAVTIPIYALTILAAVSPGAWCAALFRRRWTAARRRRFRLCPGCGYDLRATPDRCPECGTHRAGAPAAAA